MSVQRLNPGPRMSEAVIATAWDAIFARAARWRAACRQPGPEVLLVASPEGPAAGSGASQRDND